MKFVHKYGEMYTFITDERARRENRVNLLIQRTSAHTHTKTISFEGNMIRRVIGLPLRLPSNSNKAGGTLGVNAKLTGPGIRRT